MSCMITLDIMTQKLGQLHALWINFSLLRRGGEAEYACPGTYAYTGAHTFAELLKVSEIMLENIYSIYKHSK